MKPQDHAPQARALPAPENGHASHAINKNAKPSPSRLGVGWAHSPIHPSIHPSVHPSILRPQRLAAGLDPETGCSHTPPGGQHPLRTLWMWGSAQITDGAIEEVQLISSSEPLREAPGLRRNVEKKNSDASVRPFQRSQLKKRINI